MRPRALTPSESETPRDLCLRRRGDPGTRPPQVTVGVDGFDHQVTETRKAEASLIAHVSGEPLRHYVVRTVFRRYLGVRPPPLSLLSAILVNRPSNEHLKRRMVTSQIGGTNAAETRNFSLSKSGFEQLRSFMQSRNQNFADPAHLDKACRALFPTEYLLPIEKRRLELDRRMEKLSTRNPNYYEEWRQLRTEYARLDREAQ